MKRQQQENLQSSQRKSGPLRKTASLARLDRRAENVRVLAVVVSKLELGNVERQILFADLVERAHHAALDDRPEAFDGVRMDRASDVFIAAVMNGNYILDSLQPLTALAVLLALSCVFVSVIFRDRISVFSNFAKTSDSVVIHSAEGRISARAAWIPIEHPSKKDHSVMQLPSDNRNLMSHIGGAYFQSFGVPHRDLEAVESAIAGEVVRRLRWEAHTFLDPLERDITFLYFTLRVPNVGYHIRNAGWRVFGKSNAPDNQFGKMGGMKFITESFPLIEPGTGQDHRKKENSERRESGDRFVISVRELEKPRNRVAHCGGAVPDSNDERAFEGGVLIAFFLLLYGMGVFILSYLLRKPNIKSQNKSKSDG